MIGARKKERFKDVYIIIVMNESFYSLLGGVIGGMVALAGVFIQGRIQRQLDKEERKDSATKAELAALREKRTISYKNFIQFFLTVFQARYSDVVKCEYLKYVQTIEYVERLTNVLSSINMYASQDVLDAVNELVKYLNDNCHEDPTDEELLGMQKRVASIGALMRADVPGLRLHDKELGYRFFE